MQRTRRQILDILKLRGRATLEELATEVALSPVTVRVHLSVLQRDDLVNVEEVRGKVGRPYFVYSLTEEAETLFPKRYHILAGRLLKAIHDELPEEASGHLLSRVAEEWADERSSRMEGKALPQRVAEAAMIRCEEGAIAEWERLDDGFVLRQHNCPNLAVSRIYPRICEVEQDYLARILRAPVTQSTCIGRGDRVCSFRVGADVVN